MRIIYFGSGEFGIPSLIAIANSKNNLCFIVTQPSRPAGRGRKIIPTPVAVWAQDNSVPFMETADVNCLETIEKIAACKPDLIVVIAFGQKIGNQVINLPPKGIINVHASLLPKYRGAAPISWAIINGETRTGISIITVAEKMDAGNILAQAGTAISEDESADQLHDRLSKLAAPLLLETIKQISDGTASYTPQDDVNATLAPKLKKSDGFLDFDDSATNIKRKILGLWPWPGASALYKSQKTEKLQDVIFAKAEVISNSNPQKLAVGTFDEKLNVICKQDALKIIKIKPAGSPFMDFKDFVNGRATQPGDKFIKIKEYA